MKLSIDRIESKIRRPVEGMIWWSRHRTGTDRFRTGLVLSPVGAGLARQGGDEAGVQVDDADSGAVGHKEFVLRRGEPLDNKKSPPSYKLVKKTNWIAGELVKDTTVSVYKTRPS